MTKAAEAKAAPETVDFSVSGVLSRLRGTLTGWVTALASIAAVVFAGLSLGEYVKAPATADPGVATTAQVCLLLVVLGVVLLLGASGWAASLRAAPQDGAFEEQTRDPLRFFPRDTASGLRDEYKEEVARFNAARLRDDLKGMNEAAFWMNAHAARLWQWLEAYRAREASRGFKRAALLMALGALLAGVGTIGFADALRRMKSPLPAGVMMQGPRNGSVTLLGTVPPGLAACAVEDYAGQQSIPVTVVKVAAPSPAEKKAGAEYVASVVPPLTGIPGCAVQVYEVTSQQAELLVTPDSPD